MTLQEVRCSECGLVELISQDQGRPSRSASELAQFVATDHTAGCAGEVHRTPVDVETGQEAKYSTGGAL